VKFEILTMQFAVYSIASVSTGNTFQDLTRLREIAYNTERYILRDIRVTYINTGGPGWSVGTATGYGLDGPGIESRWGRDFPYLSIPALGPTQSPVQLYQL
jgi:hypothetical protein